MMKPIRCFTCGKPLGDKYEEFDRRVAEGEKPEDIFDDMGIDRYCCRRMLLTSTDFTEEIMRFQR
ncbi:MAG: DNA-directed RNA polymerase subunit N [Hadesarchaea archaeon]|nr:DNA-directed RNA polymerase subunit N [Hadesarchaea archaeon]